MTHRTSPPPWTASPSSLARLLCASAGTTEALLRMRDDGVKWAFVTNSDSFGNMGTLTTRHGLGIALLAELEAILDAQGASLPDRDLFSTYGVQ